jgi:hypothetical protein
MTLNDHGRLVGQSRCSRDIFWDLLTHRVKKTPQNITRTARSPIGTQDSRGRYCLSYRPPLEVSPASSTVPNLLGLLVFCLLVGPRGRYGRCISECRGIVPLRVSFCRDLTEMHLASDYIHPTPRGGRCRIRIYLPDLECPNVCACPTLYHLHVVSYVKTVVICYSCC